MTISTYKSYYRDESQITINLYNSATDYNLLYKGKDIEAYLSDCVDETKTKYENAEILAKEIANIIAVRSKDISKKNKKAEIQKQINLLDDDLTFKLDEVIADIRQNPDIEVQDRKQLYNEQDMAFDYIISPKKSTNEWWLQISRNDHNTWYFHSSIYFWNIIKPYKPKTNENYIELLKIHYEWLSKMPSIETLKQFKP